MQFMFIDGEKLCVYKDGEVTTYESNYIKKYREASLIAAKNLEWKKNGRTERLLNEDFFFDDEEVGVSVCSIAPTPNPNEILYSFIVNESSGIYLKYLDDDKNTEAHIISSNSVEFTSLYSVLGGLLATVKKGDVVADLAIFSEDRSDYKCITSGDSFDENPSFTDTGTVLFNSYGVARDENNNFLGYGPSEIFELDLTTMSIKEYPTKEGFSYIKPMQVRDILYCIKRPVSDEEKSNPLIDILMIPVRIAQGIVGFVSAFVHAFSGKPLVSEGKKSNGNTMIKQRRKEERSLFVLNKPVSVEKELKRNQREWNFGFIPRSWKLIKYKYKSEHEWQEMEVFSGVADFCVADTGEVIFTNGRHIFKDNGEEVERLLDTDCCIKVSPIAPIQVSNLRNYDEI